MNLPLKKFILLLLLPHQLLANTNFIEKGSSDWNVLQAVDGVDPAIADTDFNSTWFHQSFGGYVGGSYDGPAFVAGQPAPFHYGGVNGLTGGTTLTRPPSGSRYTTYFYKVFDAGNGADSIKLSLLADDGAFVYLNGQLIARDGISDPDTFTQMASLGNESDYNELSLIGQPALQPGLNLLALSLHQSSTTSSDSGFDLELSGEFLLVGENASDWAILNPIDPSNNNGYDPVTGHSTQPGDADFNTTWRNQSFGGYIGVAYDGPAFTTGQQGPFAYGGVDGIPSPNTVLASPNSGSRQTAYFIKEFDGGAAGYDKATFSILTDDGAFVYLNGNLVGVVGDLPNDASQDTWSRFTGNGGSEDTVHTLTVTEPGLIQAGTNLLAVSVHQTSATSSDLGLSLKLVGQEILAPTITRGPYLQSGSHDRMTLRWRTTEVSNSVVRYGDSPTNLTQVMTINDSVTDHVVTLTGLNPDTKYYYQIESTNIGGSTNKGAEPDYYFKTAPLPGAKVPTRIWVIGDSGTRDTNQANVYNAYRARTGAVHTDSWLMLGDNAYNSGTESEFQGAVFDAYPELLRNTTMWSCIGNHETYTNGGSPYIDIHSFPTAGECGGVASGSEYYYSYDHGNIHFICLDSATANISDTPGSGGMIDWLEADLQATDQDWIIAYFHHGPYTKGSHDSDTESAHIKSRQYLTPLLEAYGVDLVLSGHSHNYERSMLVNGHHSNMSTANSTSGTFDYATHVIDNGNGSKVGSVDGSGSFISDGGDGSYRKELGSTQSGTIYSICGASGKLSRWDNGSNALVNPEPHPVFIVNLRALGSMIINVDGDTLSAQYLDDNNVIRDDFTIEKPANGSVQVASVSQFDPVGTSVTTVSASGSGSLAYSITEGNEAGKFAIDNNTGEMTSLATFDFLEDKIYNLTIGVSDDNGPLAPILVTVNVTLDPASNNPPVANDAGFALDENGNANTLVGTVIASDPDAGDVLTYSITAGNTGNAFSIDSGSGEISSTRPLDFEDLDSYTLTVSVTDDGNPALSDSATIDIDLIDLNEAPTLANTTGSNGDADLPYTGSLGNAASDPDTNETLIFQKTAGPSWLTIGPNGSLSGTPENLHAGLNSWNVRVSDSEGLSAEATLQITINSSSPETIIAEGDTRIEGEFSIGGAATVTVRGALLVDSLLLQPGGILQVIGGQLELGDGNIISGTFTIFNSLGSWEIHGDTTFNVSQSLAMITDVHVAGGKTITVNGGGELIFDGCLIDSQNAGSPFFIEVEADGLLTIARSTITDAQINIDTNPTLLAPHLSSRIYDNGFFNSTIEAEAGSRVYHNVFDSITAAGSNLETTSAFDPVDGWSNVTDPSLIQNRFTLDLALDNSVPANRTTDSNGDIFVKSNDLFDLELNISNLGSNTIVAAESLLAYNSDLIQLASPIPTAVTADTTPGLEWQVLFESANSASSLGLIDSALGLLYQLGTPNGTSADGTIARVKYRAHDEGVTYGFFRVQTDHNYDPGGNFIRDTRLTKSQLGIPSFLTSYTANSGRIVIDDLAPTIAGGASGTQIQTSAASNPVNIFDTIGNFALRNGNVATITFTASDAGEAGLDASDAHSDLALTADNGTTTLDSNHYSVVATEDTNTGIVTYTVSLSIPQTATPGTYDVTATLLDRSGNQSAQTSLGNFVITNELFATVELQGFTGLTREVTFVATGGTKKTWTKTVNFTGAVGSLTLGGVPAGTSHLSAKTEWNLRSKVPTSFSPDGYGTASHTGTNLLPGGDITGDNVVNTLDYSKFRFYWMTPNLESDISGDGATSLPDYSLLRLNFHSAGDPE